MRIYYSIFNIVRNLIVYLHSLYIPKRPQATGDVWSGFEVGIHPTVTEGKKRESSEKEQRQRREEEKTKNVLGRGEPSSLNGMRANTVKSV